MARKIKREQIAIAVAVVAVIMLITSGGISITGAVAGVNNIPDNQCYNMARGKDNAAKNLATEHIYTGQMPNPCIGETMTYDSYLDPHMGGFYRRVYENGDVTGHIMLTDYILCSDGRAMVYSRLGAHYYNKGNNPWGLWLFNPHLANQYKIEKCDTI
ncbi:hypothetical protein KY343_06315 [Candidatus Woesearchaeota archaeon]|nr:hypothetical protein [Candidatus Woesearchaeota archaeon]